MVWLLGKQVPQKRFGSHYVTRFYLNACQGKLQFGIKGVEGEGRL